MMHNSPGQPDYKAVFDSLPGIYLLLNSDLTIAAASNDRLLTTNTTREQIIGHNIFEVFPDNPEDPHANGVKNLRESLEIVLQTKECHRMAIQRYDIPKSRNSNLEFEERYWSPLNSPVLNDKGEVIFIIHHVEDETERIKAQNQAKQLEESEFRFRQIANALPQPVWTARPDGHIDWCNDKYEQYSGLSPLQNDTQIRSSIHSDDLLFSQEQWERSIATGRPLNIEQRIRSKDGHFRWHLSKAEPIRDESGRILKWVGSTTDIHDQKMFSQGLEQERDLRERFVSTLSHDLRTPLTSVRFSAQLLERKAADQETVRAIADKIITYVDRSDRMIRDLLDANRIHAGEKIPLDISECNLSKIIYETIENLEAIHGDLYLVNVPNAPILGYWSSSGLIRVLENLCNNAVKYGSKERKITVTLAHSNSRITLSVHNWGEPIALEDQKLLFDPYRRSGSAHAGQEKGWGLGLTLVKGITESHKGSIEVESTIVKGTTFRISLPLDTRDAFIEKKVSYKMI